MHPAFCALSSSSEFWRQAAEWSLRDFYVNQSGWRVGENWPITGGEIDNFINSTIYMSNTTCAGSLSFAKSLKHGVKFQFPNDHIVHFQVKSSYRVSQKKCFLASRVPFSLRNIFWDTLYKHVSNYHYQISVNSTIKKSCRFQWP